MFCAIKWALKDCMWIQEVSFRIWAANGEDQTNVACPNRCRNACADVCAMFSVFSRFSISGADKALWYPSSKFYLNVAMDLVLTEKLANILYTGTIFQEGFQYF